MSGLALCSWRQRNDEGSAMNSVSRSIPLDPAPFLRPLEFMDGRRAEQLASKLASDLHLFLWSGGDSNSRPLPCEGSALPAELPPLGGARSL
jgi:hypothetical protein